MPNPEPRNMTTAEDPTVHHAMSWCSQLDTHIARVDERLADVEAWMEQALALARVQRDAESGERSLSGNNLAEYWSDQTQRALRKLAIANERAETAERERDEAREDIGRRAERIGLLIDERDALREALRTISQWKPGPMMVTGTDAIQMQQIAAAALASATPTEGGSDA